MTSHQHLIRSDVPWYHSDALAMIKEIERLHPDEQVTVIHRYAYYSSSGWKVYTREVEKPKRVLSLVQGKGALGTLPFWKPLYETSRTTKRNFKVPRGVNVV